jgi:hypothetical protein
MGVGAVATDLVVVDQGDGSAARGQILSDRLALAVEFVYGRKLSG